MYEKKHTRSIILQPNHFHSIKTSFSLRWDTVVIPGQGKEEEEEECTEAFVSLAVWTINEMSYWRSR